MQWKIYEKKIFFIVEYLKKMITVRDARLYRKQFRLSDRIQSILGGGGRDPQIRFKNTNSYDSDLKSKLDGKKKTFFIQSLVLDLWLLTSSSFDN